MKNNLMTDEDLSIFIESLNENFSKIYVQEDYLSFKINAERFLDFYREIKPRLNFSDITLKKWLSNKYSK